MQCGDGNVFTRWGGEGSHDPGRLGAPHGIAVDSRGDLYVSEVATSYNFGAAPQGWGVIRKYVRR